MTNKNLTRALTLVVLAPVLFQCHSPVEHDRRRGFGGRDAAGKIVKKANSLGLVAVTQAAPGVVVSLPYATSRNITGEAIYPSGMPCLVHRNTARKLAAANRDLQRHGYRLKIWDGYRPPRSHLRLWAAAPNSNYIVEPTTHWSRHCNGTAVDVTVVDSWGRELRMPTGFDDFTPNAGSDYQGNDPVVAANLQLLQRAMRKAGFQSIPMEWWHFWDPNAGKAPVISSDRLGIKLPPEVRKMRLPGR